MIHQNYNTLHSSGKSPINRFYFKFKNKILHAQFGYKNSYIFVTKQKEIEFIIVHSNLHDPSDIDMVKTSIQQNLDKVKLIHNKLNQKTVKTKNEITEKRKFLSQTHIISESKCDIFTPQRLIKLYVYQKLYIDKL